MSDAPQVGPVERARKHFKHTVKHTGPLTPSALIAACRGSAKTHRPHQGQLHRKPAFAGKTAHAERLRWENNLSKDQLRVDNGKRVLQKWLGRQRPRHGGPGHERAACYCSETRTTFDRYAGFAMLLPVYGRSQNCMKGTKHQSAHEARWWRKLSTATMTTL